MSIKVNNTTITALNYRSASGLYTPKAAMVKTTTETAYNQYNWNYVHGNSTVTEHVTNSTLSVVDFRTFAITPQPTNPGGTTYPYDFFTSTSCEYHVVIGYRTGSCITPDNSLYILKAWADIVTRRESDRSLTLYAYGPNANAVSNISLTLVGKALHVQILYPVLDNNGVFAELLRVTRRTL